MTGFYNILLMAWAAITVVLAGLFMWRYLAGFREENVVILDAGGSSMATEQREIGAKLLRINGLLKVLGGLWALVAVCMVGLWLNQAWISFNGGA